MEKQIIQIENEQCIGCQMCVKDCPAKNIVIQNHKAAIVNEECIMCGHCVAICPKSAVSIKGNDDKLISNTGNYRLNPEDVLKTIRLRRTIRQFQNRDIEQPILDQILEAGRLTHTAKNAQDVSFIVLDQEKADLEMLAVQLFRRIKPIANLFSPMVKRFEITDDFFFFNAPKVIVIVAHDAINGALAAQNMEFVAEAYGIGVLYSGFFTMATNHSRRIKRIFNLPKGTKVITTLVLGYPKVQYQRSAPRKKKAVKYL